MSTPHWLTHLNHHPPWGHERLGPGLSLVLVWDRGHGHRDGSMFVSGLCYSGLVALLLHVPGLGHCGLHFLPSLPLRSRGHEPFLPAERVQQHRVPLLLPCSILLLLQRLLYRELLRAPSGFPWARRQRQHRSHDDNRMEARGTAATEEEEEGGKGTRRGWEREKRREKARPSVCLTCPRVMQAGMQGLCFSLWSVVFTTKKQMQSPTMHLERQAAVRHLLQHLDTPGEVKKVNWHTVYKYTLRYTNRSTDPNVWLICGLQFKPHFLRIFQNKSLPVWLVGGAFISTDSESALLISITTNTLIRPLSLTCSFLSVLQRELSCCWGGVGRDAVTEKSWLLLMSFCLTLKHLNTFLSHTY